jgi:predicted Zn finger-like uncharacterized protein
MILECPQCRSRYLVPDGAIGVEGRTVRCANCRHSWFQEGVAPPPPPPPALEPAPFAAATPSEPIADTPPGYEQPVTQPELPPLPPEPLAAPVTAVDDPEPTRAPRRNPARRWTVAAVVAGLLMIAGVGIILWSSAPGLLAQIGLPIGTAESPLRLVDNPIERRNLTNGSELFAVSGKVLNPSATAQRVPDIRADLRDASGRIVFSWTITPQQRTLAPKSAIDFNSAKLDVPATSKRLELSFVGEPGA